MEATIIKWGNSQAISLPKQLLKEINLNIDEKVDITTKDNLIIIKKIEPKPKRKNIKELFEGYEDNYTPEVIDWGKPVGKEIW